MRQLRPFGAHLQSKEEKNGMLPADLAKTVNRVLGLGMTHDGNIAVAAPGVVALLDRDLNKKGFVTFPGELVDNSIAIDETGIYVVSSNNMYKVVWTGGASRRWVVLTMSPTTV